MSKTIILRCSACVFAELIGQDKMLCRRKSPGATDGCEFVAWPVVRCGDWCGEGEEKDDE